MKINSLPISPVVNNNSTAQNNNNPQNVAFKGDFINAFKPEKLLELGRLGPMQRGLFVLNAFVFLLGSRLVTARDKKESKTNDQNLSFSERTRNYIRKNNEKREILVRDIPTILIAVMGVPMLSKLATKGIQKSSGFAISEKLPADPKKPQKAPNATDISYAQINDWYKYDDSLASKFKGFTQRLVDNGGDLKKIFSKLGDDVKAKVTSLDKQNALSSEQFHAKLFDNSAESRELLNIVEGAFKDGNKALKHAEALKTGTNVFGLISTLLLVGLCIPKFNIFLTEKINGAKKPEQDKKEESAAVSA